MKQKQRLIKICGLRSSDQTETAVKLGANMIGILCDEQSKRYVPLSLAAEIAGAAKAVGATPVAVFVDKNAEQMQSICETIGVTVVQTHGALSRSQHHLLPEHYTRIYVRAVDPTGKLVADDSNGIQYLNQNRDYLLFDGIQGGSGKSFSLSSFSNPYPFPYFLAGGLNAENVAQAIKTVLPNGVDVSSGVENSRGDKDNELIKRFIEQVRHGDEDID